MLKALLQLLGIGRQAGALPAELKPGYSAQQTPLDAFKALQAPIERQQRPAAPVWAPLPGQRIELGSTGFQIVLNVGTYTPSLPCRYPVINPEGTIEVFGFDLGRLKTYAEERAAERAQFVYSSEAWKP